MDEVKNRELEKIKLNDRIEIKIEMICEAGKMVKMIENLDPDTIRKETQKKLTGMVEKLPEETKDEIKKCESLYQEYRQVKKYLDLGDQGMPDYLELVERENNLVDCIEKIKAGKHGGEIILIERINTFFHNIVEKREKVLEWKKIYDDNKNNFLIGISKVLNANGYPALDWKTVNEINFKNIVINIIVDPDLAGKKFEGCNLRQEAVNIIANHNSVQVEHTSRFEYNQAIYENVSERGGNKNKLIRYIKNHAARLLQLIENNAPAPMIEREKNSIINIITNQTYAGFADVLADLDYIKEGNIFHLKEIIEADKIFALFRQKIESLAAAENNHEAGPMLKNFASDIKKAEDEYRQKSINFITKLPAIMFAAEKSRRLLQAKACLILFGPEKLVKTERYLKKFPEFGIYNKIAQLFFAEQAYQTNGGEYISLEDQYLLAGQKRAEKNHIYQLVNQKIRLEKFFQPENIEEVTAMILKDNLRLNININEEQYVRLNNRLINFDFRKIPEEQEEMWQNPEILADYQQKIKFIFDRIQFAGQKIPVNFEKLVIKATEKCLEKAIKQNNFSILSDLTDRFEKMTKTIDITLSNLCHEQVFQLYFDHKQIKYNYKSIKTTGLWSWLLLNKKTEAMENLANLKKINFKQNKWLDDFVDSFKYYD